MLAAVRLIPIIRYVQVTNQFTSKTGGGGGHKVSQARHRAVVIIFRCMAVMDIAQKQHN